MTEPACVSRLHWTNDPPAIPGWYWMQHAVFEGAWHELHPTIVEVSSDPDGKLVLRLIGTDWSRAVDDVVVAEWAGPLQPPPGQHLTTTPH
jgi:hypothetical protein